MNRASSKRNRRLRARLSLLVAGVSICLVGFAATPALSLAVSDDPVNAQYNNPVVQANAGGGAGNAGPNSSAQAAPPAKNLQGEIVSGLPFTGFDVIALAAVALALTSIGFALRRFTTRREHTA